jgi:hypothetical protein
MDKMKNLITAVVFSLTLGCSSPNITSSHKSEEKVPAEVTVKGELNGLILFENATVSIPWKPNLTFEKIYTGFGGRNPFGFFIITTKANGEKKRYSIKKYFGDTSTPRIEVESGMTIHIEGRYD